MKQQANFKINSNPPRETNFQNTNFISRINLSTEDDTQKKQELAKPKGLHLEKMINSPEHLEDFIELISINIAHSKDSYEKSVCKQCITNTDDVNEIKEFFNTKGLDIAKKMFEDRLGKSENLKMGWFRVINNGEFIGIAGGTIKEIDEEGKISIMHPGMQFKMNSHVGKRIGGKVKEEISKLTMQNIDEFSTKARFVTSFYGSNEASLKFQLRNGLLKDVGELKPVEGVENAFYLNLPINQYLERITAKQSVKSKL